VRAGATVKRDLIQGVRVALAFDATDSLSIRPEDAHLQPVAQQDARCSVASHSLASYVGVAQWLVQRVIGRCGWCGWNRPVRVGEGSVRVWRAAHVHLPKRSLVFPELELAQEADGAHGEAQYRRYVFSMAEQATSSQQRAVASKRADQVGFIRKVLRCALALLVCVYRKRKLLVKLFSSLGIENDVYRRVGGAYVGRELYHGLGDVWCALLLGDEDVARWGRPLQAQ